MLGTLFNKHSGLFLALLFFLFHSTHAQEEQQSPIDLVSYIKSLEDRFNVKFSYINEDMDGLSIEPPENLRELEDILQFIETQFQIKTEKLSV